MYDADSMLYLSSDIMFARLRATVPMACIMSFETLLDSTGTRLSESSFSVAGSVVIRPLPEYISKGIAEIV